MMGKVKSTYTFGKSVPLAGERVCLYDADEQEWRYCHHPAICGFKGRMYAIWSNGRLGEDAPGQRVMLACSEDGLSWSEPKVLLEAFPGKYGRDTVLTAVGFYVYGGTMNVYAASYDYKIWTGNLSGRYRPGGECRDTELYVLVTKDGETFSEPKPLHLPTAAVFGPRALKSGRLLMSGNWAHAYTDDPAGLSGWKLRGYPVDAGKLEEPIRDDPTYFQKAARAAGLPVEPCEGAFIEDGDGVLHMLQRTNTPVLWQSDSFDGGEHWTLPEETDFPDGSSKFWIGQLPDGRWAYVGNPGPDRSRCPLVLSLSEDGASFDTHYLIETKPRRIKYPGDAKDGLYAYPHAVSHCGFLYVIYSVFKEDIVLQRFPLSVLR